MFSGIPQHCTDTFNDSFYNHVNLTNNPIKNLETLIDKCFWIKCFVIVSGVSLLYLSISQFNKKH
jgi:hypothetical protein